MDGHFIFKTAKIRAGKNFFPIQSRIERNYAIIQCISVSIAILLTEKLIGAVHKTSARKGEGVFQMRTSALFGAKTFGFFEIYGVLSTRTRGRVEPLWTI